MAQTPATPPPGTATDAAKPAREDGLYATLQTTQGNIVVKLYEKESPITVKNFVDLALGKKAWTDPKTGKRTTRPLYPGTIFHRVIENFMIQGGDPEGTGMGGTDVIKDEFHPTLKFDVPGRLAMANAGLGTGSSQFFITEVPTPHLNGGHTIFGQTVEGLDIVKKIARVPKRGDRPVTPVVLQKITFERVGPGPQPGAPAAKPGATKKGATAPATGTATKKAPTSPATKKTTNTPPTKSTTPATKK